MQPGEQIENLIADLEDVIDQAKPSFGGGGQKKVIEVDELYQIIDELRDSFPSEFQVARRILKEQDEILAHAQSQADSIIADAQQQAMILASDQEVVRLAQGQADEIRSAAQQYERDTRYDTEQYADEVLSHLEENMRSIVSQVSRCRQTLSENSTNSTNQSW